MKIRITPEILRDFPSLLLGVIIVKNVDNSRSISAVQQLVQGAAAAKRHDLQKNPKRESLRYFQAIQESPSRLEELFRIVKNGQVPVSGTPIEDLMNYFSIRAEIPMRTEDLDEVCGDLELAYSEGTEPFRMKGTTRLEHPVSGEMMYRDRAGVTCRLLNSVECERTAPVNTTKNLVLITENFGQYGIEKMKEILKEVATSIQKYCRGTIELHILGERVSEVDLGITGRTGVSENDFKPNEKRLQFHQKILERQAQQAKLAEAYKEPAKMTSKKMEIPAEKLTEKSTEKSTIKSPKKTSEKIPEKTAKPSVKKRVPLLVERLHELVIEAAKKAFPELAALTASTQSAPFPHFSIDQPKEESHGDYACNVALVLTKTLKIAPKEIAEKILGRLEQPQYVEKAQFAPPGFINFFIAEKWLKKELENIIAGKAPYDHINEGAGRTVIVEYSSPNVAKPLGAHHLITTVLGQALYNMYKFLGFNTISVNHIGDWGTQFGKLLVAYEKWGSKRKVEKNPIDELLVLYVKFHDEVEALEKQEKGKGEALEEEARAMFKKLEDGDEEVKKLWQWVVDVSMKDVQKTYDALGGIHFDYTQGESFYEDKMQPIIDEGIKKKIFVEGENGSLIAKFTAETVSAADEPSEKFPPMLVKKSDGATLYATRDLAQMTYRINTWHPEKILYVVDVAQSLHFQQLIETMQKFGTHGTELIHVSFGRMRFADQKMSTRKGNIIRLDEVLKEAVSHAKKIVREHAEKEAAEKKSSQPKSHENKLAIAIGVSAVKYNILSQNRISDIVFDWDRMLSLEGNSSPYLQYAYARTQSILRKAEDSAHAQKSDLQESKKTDKLANQVNLFEAIEEAATDKEALARRAAHHENLLRRKLVKFPEILLRTAEEYKPNMLCTYLYELAQEFNSFYHTAPVLQAESSDVREERLQIVRAVGVVMEKGLKLLGIEAVEKM